MENDCAAGDPAAPPMNIAELGRSLTLIPVRGCADIGLLRRRRCLEGRRLAPRNFGPENAVNSGMGDPISSA